MRFMMFMIPKVYQPETPPGERAGEGFAPPAESVTRMMKFNEELAKEEAVEWAKRIPAQDGDMIEIRQVFEDLKKAIEDLASALTAVARHKSGRSFYR